MAGTGRRDMDAAFSLDTVTDLEAVFARRSAAAAAALARFPAERGLRYGPGPGETLNVFPAGPGAPVMVFIHGGFWRSLDADLFSFLAPGFVPAGAALVVIDYPLIPEVRLAQIAASCRRAVDWVRANAERFGGDPNRVFVSGNSAGGHLVAELMDREGGATIRGGTAISGVFDLEPVTRSFQNDSLTLTADEVAVFSPLTRAVAIAAPLIVAVGGDETAEFLRQSAAFAARCGVPSIEVPGTNHITVLLDALAVPGHPLNAAVLRQMGLPG
jgi:arylformamidase